MSESAFIRPTSRRAFLGIAGASLTAAALAYFEPASTSVALDRDYFSFPSAALLRPIGKIAAGSCAPFPAAQVCQGAPASPFDAAKGNFPLAVPGLGIPLGGVGAGSFMVNQSGTFGPWNFGGEQGASWEMRVLPQAAFHVREKVGNGSPTVRTLATAGPTTTGTEGPVPQRSWQSPLPGWDSIQPGEGNYASLYPFGWMTYTTFQTDVSIRFFSPLVAGEDRRTSLPVAYFDVRLANRTAQPAEVSVMFTMPNAPAHVAGTQTDPTIPTGPPSVRKGFSSRHTSRAGVEGVTLTADAPDNTPDSANSEWTIAAKPLPGQKFTYTSSWNGSGDGSDVYAPFVRDGRLPNQNLDSSASAGAIAVSVKLAPGEATTVSFALAWDFPQVAFASNRTVWMRRYTNFYGAQQSSSNDYIDGSYPGRQSFNIARDSLIAHDSALQAVMNWWEPLANDATYPEVLRTAALNQLSQLVWNNSFWEGGLVRNEVVPTGFAAAGPGNHLGASRPGTHLFGIQDTGGGGISGTGTTTDIQSYAYRGYYSLFPNLFTGRLLASAEAVMLASNRNAPDLYVGVPGGDPFITWGNAQDAAIQGGTDSRSPMPGRTQWIDSPSKFMLEWYAYSKITGDQGMLRATWPAMKHEIAFLRATVPAGTHLPLDPGVFANIYNLVPQTGAGLYNSQLYLLALTIGIATGEQLSEDMPYVIELRTELEAAKFEFEATFWNPVQQYYRFTNGGPYLDSILVDSFFAQHIAEDLGLPDLVNPTRHRAQLALHYKASRRYSDGEMIGAPMLVQPGGLESPNGNLPPESSWVWPGSAWAAAADYYATGKRFNDPTLKSYGAELGSAVATQIWLRAENGFQFDPPCGWSDSGTDVYNYPAYSHAMAVWGLMHAIKPLPGAARA